MKNSVGKLDLGKATGDKNKSSCVAWFKLAELISRREKEKALSLFRLLSHSFVDKAYALQLEGDILWSLDDEQAFDKYSKAAFLYRKEKRISSAIAIYEHLLTLQPNNYEYLSTLVVLYVLIYWPEKFEERYKQLLDLFNNGTIEQGTILDFTKKVVDFAVDSTKEKKTKKKNVKKDVASSNNHGRDFSWLLNSLFSILDKRKIVFTELVKEYCLEHDLNFNS